MQNKTEPGLVHFVCQDYSGITRGRGFSRQRLAGQMNKGVGWVPANLWLNPFGNIVENPVGSMGDLLLMPDPQTELYLGGHDQFSPLHYFLSDMVHLDGSPWSRCPRHFLKQQIAKLAAMGIEIMASFEHEFMLPDIAVRESPFSLAAARTEEALCSALLAALEAAQLEPECVLPEYAARQYEVTCKPTSALNAADRAVHTREVVREVCRRQGRKVSFSPVLAGQEGTNGVHIHFSLWSTSGQALTYDAQRPGQLSELASRFTAGVLAHLPALTCLTAPGVVSYQRLRPHSWSAAYACVGQQNREAALRIAPVHQLEGSDPALQANVEYRPADALSSPYLALGALLAAGIDGLQRELILPELVQTDPANLAVAEHARYGLRTLPETLEQALNELAQDAVLQESIGADILDCYQLIKQSEVHELANQSEEAIRECYAAVY